MEPLAAVVVLEFFQEVGAKFGLELVEVFLAEFADFGGVRGFFGRGSGFQNFLEVLEIDNFVDFGCLFLVICCWFLPLFALGASRGARFARSCWFFVVLLTLLRFSNVSTRFSFAGGYGATWFGFAFKAMAARRRS